MPAAGTSPLSGVKVARAAGSYCFAERSGWDFDSSADQDHLALWDLTKSQRRGLGEAGFGFTLTLMKKW